MADKNKNATPRPPRRKEKKTIPADKLPLVCPPDRAGLNLGSRIAGMGCRMFVIFMAVFGLAYFLCDALRLEQQEINVSAGFLAGVSLLFVVVYSAMALSRWCAAGGAVALVGAAAVIVISSGEAAQLFPRMFETAKNVALTRLFNLGYYGMSRYITEVSYNEGRGAEYYMRLAFLLVIAVIALVFVLSCIKRVRLVGPVIVSAVIISVVFTYNISRSNWGTVLIIAAFVGIIAMLTYDRIFSPDAPNRDRYDSDTVLFADDERPPLPDGMLTPEAAKRERIRRRREERETRRQHKKDKTLPTVEEELDSYFGAPAKARKPLADKRKTLTPEEKLQRREADAALRRAINYDRNVATSRRAQGGFAAVGAFVMAMLILLLPALTVAGSFTTIEAIDKKMEYYREYVTALLMGDDPILDELGYQNNKDNFIPRTTDAAPRYYTGRKLMTVESQYAANVYLRGWIGTSYSNGAWNACSDDALDAYRKLYGTTLDPNEILFNLFYSIMDESVVEPKDFTSSSLSKLKYGFVAMQVNVRREKTDDALVYMPSFYRVDDVVKAARATSHGLYKYGTSEEDTDTTFVDYFDGIYTGRRFMAEHAYASVAYVTLMRTRDWYRNVADLISQFNAGYNDAYEQIEKYASRRANGRNASLDDIVGALYPEYSENLVAIEPGDESNTVFITVDYPRGRVEYKYNTVTGKMVNYRITKLTEFTMVDEETGEVTTYTLAFAPPGIDLCTRYRVLMTTEQKNALAYAYYWQYLYENFVYETYSTPYRSTSEVVRNTLRDIAAAYDAEHADKNGYKLVEAAAGRHSESADTYEARHRLVMEIVDYFKENFTYTLTPTAATDPDLDGVDNFLSVTHEGYCTQYASALALMMRAAGVPARYVEGYVACDFVRSYASDAVGRYTATVRDYNAHAWVEVWYDGVGWVQYEATPVYYDDMYVQRGGSQGGTTTRPWYNTDEEDETQNLLDSVSGSLGTAEGLVETLSDDLRFLIGGGTLRQELDAISEKVSAVREQWTALDSEYQANKDVEGYNPSTLETNLRVLDTMLAENVITPLTDLDTRIEALKNINATVRNIAVGLLAAALVVLLVLLSDRRAKKAERARMKLVDDAAAGLDNPEHRRETAHSIINWLTSLLAAYGSAPRAGEFSADYARRLEEEYLGIFGRVPTAHAEDAGTPPSLVSDTDFVAIFDAVAAEEFGNGMSDDQLREVAVFCKRMRGAAARRLSAGKRLYYHFVKKLV